MIGALTDHLWQSTLFVLAAALIAAALRKNGAHIRHAVWVAASVKFLLPFAVLMGVGGALPIFTPAPARGIAPAAATSDLTIAVDRIVQPMAMEINYFQISSVEYFVPISVRMPGSELARERPAGSSRAIIDMIGEIQDEYGRHDAELTRQTGVHAEMG